MLRAWARRVILHLLWARQAHHSPAREGRNIEAATNALNALDSNALIAISSREVCKLRLSVDADAIADSSDNYDSEADADARADAL